MLIFGENYGVPGHIRLDVIELLMFTPRQATRWTQTAAAVAPVESCLDISLYDGC
jgi:hypothetical protein